MASVSQDLRYAVRLLLKAPIVSCVAIVSLALGIGANTAIFGVINALMLRSLPVPDPQELVSIDAIDPEHPEHERGISLAMFHEIQQHATVFSNVFVWTGGGMSNIEANGTKYPGAVDGASGDYFAGLGVRPVLGRVLTRDDAPLDGRPSAQIAVLSYGCWQQRFGSDPHVLGKTIRVDDIPVTVVGVTPPDFNGLIIDTSPAATVPFGFSHHELKYRETIGYSFFGRLRPGVSISQARAQIQVLWPGILKSTVPDGWRGTRRSKFFALRPDLESASRGNSYLRKELEKPLEILMALVGAVLLIACVNLANLLLARVAARQHEFGVRVAMGAGRWPLIRMLLTEAILISCTGSVLGLLVARWTSRYLLASVWTGYVPLALDPSPDARVAAFAVALAIFTGLLFGIVPAWRTSRSDPAKLLGQSARTTGGRTGRFSRSLITAQVALSLVLLFGATLFVRTLQNLRNVNLGYRRDHLLLVQLYPQPGHDKIPNRVAYFHELAERVSQLPGIQSVSYLHMGPTNGFEYKVPVSTSAGMPMNAVEEWAGPGFFRMIGMRVLAGREFTWRDDERAPRVAIVSESLARALFPKQNPIGQVINIGTDPEHQGLRIIGVANSASLWKFDDRNTLAVYHTMMQEPTYNQVRLLIRTLRDPMTVAHSAEQTLESLGYQYSLRTESIDKWTDDALILQRTIALLASGFSLLALLLAAVGLYGVMSYAVTRRTAEMGVRMALGAMPSDVLSMILHEVLLLITVGIAIAIPIAFACGKLVSGMLYGVSLRDPATVLVSGCTLIAVAALAGFIPARRASSVDPMVALRYE
jgi:predicted permease